MPVPHIFISHATADDAFVADLRTQLESLNLPVWVDSRNLRGGAKLMPEIQQAIEQARQVLVVLSPHTVNSPWVRQEINAALAVEQQRQQDGYRVIPLLLPGILPSALGNWFDEEPVAVPVALAPGRLDEALPAILAALGERLPDDWRLAADIATIPVEELLLKLSDPTIETANGKRRAKATAELIYEPADAHRRPVESRRYSFTAPLGPIEAEDLRWYLESFYLWPTNVFQQRAREIEQQLPSWGQALYQAVLTPTVAQEAFRAWPATGRRFSVEVDRELRDGATAADKSVANEAASALLALPWELLHDGRAYLFDGANGVRVRRRLPNRHPQPPAIATLPIRILLVSPRPEDAHTGYLDHRLSARPLLDAVESLGGLAELTVLQPPTRPALEQALRSAGDANKPFAVVHFDGHGIYDREYGL